MADVLPDLALRPGRVDDAAALRAVGEAFVPATYGTLHAAAGFYRGHGFAEVERVPRPPYPDDVWMRKDL